MMDRLLSSLIVLIFLGSSVLAQHIAEIEHPVSKLMKFENQLIISWRAVSKDPADNQIEVFDEHGQRLAALSVLRSVQDAQSVAVYDVSARPGRMIAVSAVYRSNEGNTAAMLLLFDFRGQLLSALLLKPSREILRLAVDEQSNVWTLTAHADGQDPSTIPMIVEYTSEGTVARELLTRSMFPFHASKTIENQTIGSPSMGYDSKGLWFWLPGSTELVTMSIAGGAPVIVKTGMPGGKRAEALGMTRNMSGDLVLQTRGDDGAGGARINQFIWSKSGNWIPLAPVGCGREGDWLIGANDKGLAYAHHETGRSGICLLAEH